jgi:hypothetical protein
LGLVADRDPEAQTETRGGDLRNTLIDRADPAAVVDA